MCTLRSLVALASALVIGALASPAARAAVAYTTSSTISTVMTFTEYGTAITTTPATNGDVVFQLASSGLSACSFGFWIRGSDIGAKNTLAQLLAAYHTGAPVVVAADTDPANFWPGNSSSHACLVWSVQS